MPPSTGQVQEGYSLSTTPDPYLREPHSLEQVKRKCKNSNSNHKGFLQDPGADLVRGSYLSSPTTEYVYEHAKIQKSQSAGHHA